MYSFNLILIPTVCIGDAASGKWNWFPTNNQSDSKLKLYGSVALLYIDAICRRIEMICEPDNCFAAKPIALFKCVCWNEN